MLIEHEKGACFEVRGYNLNEATEFLRKVIDTEEIFFYKRIMHTISDYKLNAGEVSDGIETGRVMKVESTPERWQLRMEILPPSGDAAAFHAVVYVDRDHKLFCEDLRPVE